MHALADEEGAGVVDGLRVEEVVLHVSDTGADFGREKGLALGDHLVRSVLDEEGELRELLGRDYVSLWPREDGTAAA